MLRISTTTLEQYRRLVATEWGDEAELIASIRGEPFKPSWQMEAGTAWHSVLEAPRSHERWDDATDHESGAYYQSGDYTFNAAHVAKALEHIGRGLWEVKATREIEGALIVAKADHVRGTLLQDNKTKFSTIDPRDYEPALQWRFYLLIHDAACLRYNLFAFSEPKDGYCALRDIVSFKFWPYPALEADCRQWVRRFIDWADSRGLLGYLERQSSTPEAA